MRELVRMRSFWLFLVGVIVTFAVFGETFRIPGDLTVGGTSDVTGETIARSGVRLTAPTTGPILKSGTGSPNGVVSATKGSIYLQTDTAGLWQNTNGATAWSASVAGATASVSVVDSGSGPSVNFSTLGDIDWYANGTVGNTNPPAAFNANAIHSKVTGGWIANSLRWRNIGAAFSFTSGRTYSTTASDDVFGSALSSAAVAGVQGTAGAMVNGGEGLAFRVPARTTSTVLRIYNNAAGCDGGTPVRTVTATLRIAGTTNSATFGDGSLVTVTFNSTVPGDELIVTVLLAQGTGTGNCTLCFGGFSLGTS